LASRRASLPSPFVLLHRTSHALLCLRYFGDFFFSGDVSNAKTFYRAFSDTKQFNINLNNCKAVLHS
jgi:hypothetical protein